MFRNLSLLSVLFLVFPLMVGFAPTKAGDDNDWRLVWAVLAAAVVIWFVLWWLDRARKRGHTETHEPQPKPEPAVEAATAPEALVEPDDLKIIEGIGPKIAGVLQKAGIRTFRDLASADVERLQKILEDAGPRYRLADPDTWPEQAALAANGKWEELEKLQDALKGGRRA